MVALITDAVFPSENVTILFAGVVLNPEPEMITVSPIAAVFGVMESSTGADIENITAFEVPSLVFTVTLPLVEPSGTTTISWMVVALVGLVVVPLKLTVLPLTDDAKLLPEMVTVVATGPLLGVIPVIDGPAANEVPIVTKKNTQQKINTIRNILAPYFILFLLKTKRTFRSM